MCPLKVDLEAATLTSIGAHVHFGGVCLAILLSGHLAVVVDYFGFEHPSTPSIHKN